MSSHLAKKKVVVVDDMDSMRSVAVKVIRNLGINLVVGIEKGSRAREFLRRNACDLIICDWNMPDVTGLEVLKAVRSDGPNQKTPFVMLTGNVQEDRVREAIQAGINDYIAKPFQPSVLEAKVLQLLDESD